MATYKVIQDVEAEDKLLGPLTFRQFVYAGAAAFSFYLSFLVITKNAAVFAAVFLPFGTICAFFAWPFAGDQPTEVWALAKIRFFVKPRKRIWNQSGVKELVTVTAPKKLEKVYTNGLTESEVTSRLRALADTIDSRGWAIKNVNVNMSSQPASLMMNEPDSDRLISMSSLPQTVPSTDIQASDDIMDEQNNPIAQQFDSMIAASTKAHRQQIVDRLRESSAPPPPPALPKTPAPMPSPRNQQQPQQPANNYWFLNRPTLTSSQDAVTFNAQVVTPGAPVASLPTVPADPTQEEEELVRQLSQQNTTTVTPYAHLHTIQPLSVQAQQAKKAAEQAAAQQVTQPPDAAILNLARNDDLNVATIAREAKRAEELQDEVVISLH